MEKLLNKFAVWLYNKTKGRQIPSKDLFFSGIKVVESKYILEGTCVMGTGDIKEMRKVFQYEEINKLNKNVPGLPSPSSESRIRGQEEFS